MRVNLPKFSVKSLDKRRVGRVAAVVVIALAAGHLVQTMAKHKAPAPEAALVKPASVVQLAGTNDLPAAPPAPVAPSVPPLALKPATPPVPAPVAVVDPCPVTLDLMTEPGAMIGVTLLAPCHPSERIVLRHAGLAVTLRSTATGAVFTALPGLQSDATVEVMFADGTTIGGRTELAELAGLRRFGVQWQADDAFQLYGYEAGGVVSAAAPGQPPLGDAPSAGGYLTRLGDAGVDAPLLAEIYTYPVDEAADPVIEAAVTPATCGRELLGETLSSVGGVVKVTDLTVAMPDCDAVGDFLVLKNLAPDLTLAAAN